MASAYTLSILLSILLSFAWLGFVQPSRHPGNERALHDVSARFDLGLVALGMGLVGARLAHVLAHGSYYASYQEEILRFWQGGLSWAGGAFGGLLGVSILTWLTGRSFWRSADVLAVPAGVLAVGAWFGCFLESCAYGRIADPSIFTPVAVDLMGNTSPRLPTTGLGTLFSLLLLLLLFRLDRSSLRSGITASLTLTLISAAALGLSFTRGDPSRMLGTIRLDGFASAGLLGLGLLGLAFRIWLTSPKDRV